MAASNIQYDFGIVLAENDEQEVRWLIEFIKHILHDDQLTFSLRGEGGDNEEQRTLSNTMQTIEDCAVIIFYCTPNFPCCTFAKTHTEMAVIENFFKEKTHMPLVLNVIGEKKDFYELMKQRKPTHALGSLYNPQSFVRIRDKYINDTFRGSESETDDLIEKMTKIAIDKPTERFATKLTKILGEARSHNTHNLQQRDNGTDSNLYPYPVPEVGGGEPSQIALGNITNDSIVEAVGRSPALGTAHKKIETLPAATGMGGHRTDDPAETSIGSLELASTESGWTTVGQKVDSGKTGGTSTVTGKNSSWDLGADGSSAHSNVLKNAPGSVNTLSSPFRSEVLGLPSSPIMDTELTEGSLSLGSLNIHSFPSSYQQTNNSYRADTISETSGESWSDMSASSQYSVNMPSSLPQNLASGKIESVCVPGGHFSNPDTSINERRSLNDQNARSEFGTPQNDSSPHPGTRLQNERLPQDLEIDRIESVRNGSSVSVEINLPNQCQHNSRAMETPQQYHQSTPTQNVPVQHQEPTQELYVDRVESMSNDSRNTSGIRSPHGRNVINPNGSSPGLFVELEEVDSLRPAQNELAADRHNAAGPGDELLSAELTSLEVS